MKKKGSTIKNSYEVVLNGQGFDNLTLSIPKRLYETLESYANQIPETVAEYIVDIVNSGRFGAPDWDALPRETLTLLTLYRFCFELAEDEVKIVRSLHGPD